MAQWVFFLFGRNSSAFLFPSNIKCISPCFKNKIDMIMWQNELINKYFLITGNKVKAVFFFLLSTATVQENEEKQNNILQTKA